MRPSTSTAQPVPGADAAAAAVVSDSWFHAVFDQTAIGIAVIDGDGAAVSCNRALGRLLGRDPQEVIGHRFRDFTDPRDVDRCEAVTRRVLTGELDNFQVTKRYVRPDGSVVWGRLTVTGLRDHDDRVRYAIGVVEDFTARHRAERELAHQARHDPLTGLPNRFELGGALEAGLSRSRGRAGRVGVLVVDVDDFNNVNNALGHLAGDALLRQVASRVAEAVGDDDVVARFTGDEFVIVREGVVDPADLDVLAERVQARLSGPYALPGGRRVHLSTTVGLTIGDGGSATADSLLRDADIAVHEGKAHGPGSVRWFDDALRNRVLAEAELLADLYEALDHDELRLVYQPVVRLADGAVVAAEALLRWEHPTLGTVAPGRFLPLVEGSALLSRITWWVLRTAAAQAAAWRRASGIPVAVSVNVPAQLLLEADLVPTLEQILADAGLPAPGLVLELTEDGLVDDSQATHAILDRLTTLGVHVYIDDFGTGWSSLSYIKRLPVDGLKIDQSFVGGLPDDLGDTSIVSAVAAMASGMGLRVVAEGVETAAQLAVLEDLGIAYAQGFLLGRPTPPSDLGAAVWGRPSARIEAGRGADGLAERHVAHQH
jgi:diguanylate cyclase (GGDEF)-like protein/PAS domain S-box-containing protein